jgi:hypothetical protein
LDPRFVGSNLAKDEGFSRKIKIRSTTSFRGEVKLLFHYLGFYSMLKHPTSMEKILCRQNSVVIYHQVSPDSL